MASILLVDDDELLGHMVSLRLRARGHRVERVGDGREGIEKALSGGYDLVLLDMDMPVMDGRETVRRLRRRGYRGPVAALTASTTSRDSEAAVEAGCDHFVAKPIGGDFEQRIEDILTSS